MEITSLDGYERIQENLKQFKDLPKSTPLKTVFETFQKFLLGLEEIDVTSRFLRGRALWIKGRFDLVLNTEDFDLSLKMFNMVAQATSAIQYLQEEAIVVESLKPLMEWVEKAFDREEECLEDCFDYINVIVQCLITQGNVSEAEGKWLSEWGEKTAESLPKNEVLRALDVINFVNLFDTVKNRKKIGIDLYLERLKSIHSDYPFFNTIKDFFIVTGKAMTFMEENQKFLYTMASTLHSISNPAARNAIDQRMGLVPIEDIFVRQIKSFTNPINALCKPDFISANLPYIQTCLPQESLSLFKVLNIIKDQWNVIYNAHNRSRVRQMELSRHLSTLVKNSLEAGIGSSFKKELENKKVKVTFPIEDNRPLCRSEDDFSSLFQLKTFFSLCDAPVVKVTKKAKNNRLKRDAKEKEKRSKGEVGSGAYNSAAVAGGAGGAGVSVKADAGKSDEEDLKKFDSEEFEAVSEEVIVRKLDARFSEAENLYSKIKIDSRVQIWNEDSDKAIKIYLASLKRPQVLDSAEIILSHTFPLQLLRIVFHRDFSNRSFWKNAEGDEHPKYEAIVEFKDQKYVLEATFDKRNVLYHYNARPANSMKDLLMLIGAPSEFPPLSKETTRSSPVVSTKDSFVFDADGNAILNSYKVLKLR